MGSDMNVLQRTIAAANEQIEQLRQENEQIKNDLAAQTLSSEAWKTEAMDSRLVLASKIKENAMLKVRIMELEKPILNCPLTKGSHKVSDLYEIEKVLRSE